ncbi:MAG: hypothetical protein RBT74_14865 [Tenuifilaceae bacterium]|jgi:hypothetical protein|nr:hypothetical protein [Tenuifilaceae bacterium]
MKFQDVPGVEDLINSEGPILKLVENVDDQEMENERLYLRGTCLKGIYYIYTQVNDFVLELFFQGRISVKELFLLRKDENYIMEKRDGRQELVFCDEAFENNVLSTIECGNSHYYSLPQGMRLEDPFAEALHIVKRDYMNGIGTISAERNLGTVWIQKNI